jgi:hypothetical protein
MKIKNYGIIEETDLDLSELRNEVNEWIQEGWQPYGPLQIINSPETESQYAKVRFIQVMVEYEETPQQQCVHAFEAIKDSQGAYTIARCRKCLKSGSEL